MDVSEILTLIDNHGFTDTALSDKLVAINDALWDLSSREPWPFLEKSVTLTFSGSSGTPTNVPADFKAALSIVDTQFPRRLYPVRIEDFNTQFGNVGTQAGDPLYYYFLARTLFLWPIPPASKTTVVMTYLAHQTELTDASLEAAILLPKQHHKAILDGALSFLYFQDDDPELADASERKFEKRISEMRQEIWKTQYDRPDTIEIVDYDDLYT